MPSPRVSRPSMALILLALLCGLGPVAWAISRPVPTATTLTLSAEDGRTGTPLELPMVPEVGPERTGALVVTARSTAELVHADEIRLLMATFDTHPELKTARLRSADGLCEFAAPAGAALENNRPFVLKKVRCDVTGQGLELMLYVRIGAEGRVAAWSFPAGSSVTDEPLVVSAPDGSWHQALRGTLHIPDAGTVVRRIDLVAYLWQTRVSRVYLWGGALAALLLLGVALTAWTAGRALGLALATFAAAGAWAIIVPPLQGADEPDHLLSVNDVTHGPDDTVMLEQLARRTHFERIRFHGDETFRAGDRGRPFPLAWTGDVHAERMESRSPTAARLWRLEGRLGVVALPLPDRLLVMRLTNALILAAVVAAAAIALGITGVGSGLWALVGLALIPALPSFATMLSDWAFVTSWSVLLAASLVIAIDDGPRASWAGLAIGLSLSLLISTSIAALALLPLVAMVLLTRIALGPGHGAPGAATAAIQFWGGLALALTGGYLLTSDLFTVGYQRYDAGSGSAAALLAGVNQAVGTLARLPWLLLPALVPPTLIEWRLASRRSTPDLTGAGARVAHTVVVGIGVTVGLTTLLSVVWPLPIVRTLPDAAYPTLVSYVGHVVAALLTIGRLEGIDHLTFASLWSGFGWVDAIVPPWALSGLAGLMSAGVVASMLVLHARRRLRTTGWTGAVVLGGLLSGSAYAAAGYLMNRNVHGRYLLPLAIPLTAAVTYGVGVWLSGQARAVRLAALALVFAIHGLSLAWVLSRYY